MTHQKSNKKNGYNNIWWLSWVSYFTDFSSEMLTSFLPIYFTQTLGFSKSLVGVIEGIAESVSSLLKMVSGYLSDKIKKRKIFIIFGYGLPAFLKFGYLIAFQWWQIFILRFFERSGKGFRDPPRDALITAATKDKAYGGAFGFQRMMDTLGAVTGVITLTILLRYIGVNFWILFICAFIPGLVSFLIAIFKVKEDTKSLDSKKPIRLKDIALLPRRYKFFLIPTLIFALGDMGYAFFILRAQELGMPIEFLPIVYLIYTIIYAAISIPAGQLSDKIGKIPTLIIGNIFFLSSCMLFMFNIPNEFIAIVFILYGLFFAFNVGVCKAYISQTVPLEYNATANGIYNFITGISAFPAYAVVGFLWDSFGVQYAFGYSLILTVIATVLYMFLLPKHRMHEVKASAG